MQKNKAASNCVECVLAKQCVPSGMPANKLFRFENIVQTNVPYKAGGSLFEQHVKTNYLYVVKTGSFKTKMISPHGTEHVHNFFLPGEVIGLDSVGIGMTLNSAEALEASLACKIDYPALRMLRKEFPTLSDFSVKLYSTALASMSQVQNIISLQAASSRLAAFILLYQSRLSSPQLITSSFQLPMTRQDIASHLGLAIETVSRSFSKLIDTGCINKDGRNIHILDFEKLEQFANSSPR
ncbi:MAG: CRP/FNR family transcriptional regulator [Paraglaciecola sp.]|jgi:CRP/FNR family transcriptional regulator